MLALLLTAARADSGLATLTVADAYEQWLTLHNGSQAVIGVTRHGERAYIGTRREDKVRAGDYTIPTDFHLNYGDTYAILLRAKGGKLREDLSVLAKGGDAMGKFFSDIRVVPLAKMNFAITTDASAAAPSPSVSAPSASAPSRPPTAPAAPSTMASKGISGSERTRDSGVFATPEATATVTETPLTPTQAASNSGRTTATGERSAKNQERAPSTRLDKPQSPPPKAVAGTTPSKGDSAATGVAVTSPRWVTPPRSATPASRSGASSVGALPRRTGPRDLAVRKALAREQRQHQATREERDLLTALVTRNSVALGKPLNVLPKLILDEDGRVVNDIAVMARFEDGVKVGKLALIVPKTGAHLTYDLQIVTYEGGALEVFQLLNGAAPEQSKASRRSSFRYILVEHDTLLSDLFTRVVIIPRAPGQG